MGQCIRDSTSLISTKKNVRQLPHVLISGYKLSGSIICLWDETKETVELRLYEIPQGEPVLALLGEEWNRVYGHDNFYLHFHNLMEIGICRKGEGELIINEHTYTYRTNSVTLIPPNIPHTTISNGMTRNSWEFLYVDVNHVMEELYGDRIAQKN